MSHTNAYTEKFFHVKLRERGPFGIYDGNNSIGTFEFHTEANARRHIRENKLKGAKVVMVTRNITESVIEL